MTSRQSAYSSNFNFKQHAMLDTKEDNSKRKKLTVGFSVYYFLWKNGL